MVVLSTTVCPCSLRHDRRDGDGSGGGGGDDDVSFLSRLHGKGARQMCAQIKSQRVDGATNNYTAATSASEDTTRYRTVFASSAW